MTLILLLILVALAFEYVNGFHDAANAIATSVATRVLTARQAVTMAATCDLLGALAGTAVATTIAAGLVESRAVSLTTILCALLAAIIWNLVTWWLGLPSSSSHALIGGLCGATLATAYGNWHVIKWSVVDPVTHKTAGLLHKVVMPMFISPVCGGVVGFLFMGLLVLLFAQYPPVKLNKIFSKLQILSAAWMSFCHGLNDAQKTMGIIALTLFTGSKSGILDNLPKWLSFLAYAAIRDRVLGEGRPAPSSWAQASPRADGESSEPWDRSWSSCRPSMVSPPKPPPPRSSTSPASGACRCPPPMSSPPPSWASGPPNA